jgi:hypothetical protein
MVVIDTHWTSGCKSNYHTITTTTTRYRNKTCAIYWVIYYIPSWAFDVHSTFCGNSYCHPSLYFVLSVYLYWFRLLSSLFSILGRNNIGSVIVIVLVSSVVEPGFEIRVSQIKDYIFGIWWFSATPAALRNTSKDGLTQNQDVSAQSDMSTRGLLFQWLCWSRYSTKRTSSSSHQNLTCSRHTIGEHFPHLTLNNDHILTRVFRNCLIIIWTACLMSLYP